MTANNRSLRHLGLHQVRQQQMWQCSSTTMPHASAHIWPKQFHGEPFVQSSCTPIAWWQRPTQRSPIAWWQRPTQRSRKHRAEQASVSLQAPKLSASLLRSLPTCNKTAQHRASSNALDNLLPAKEHVSDLQGHWLLLCKRLSPVLVAVCGRNSAPSDSRFRSVRPYCEYACLVQLESGLLLLRAFAVALCG